MMYGWIGSGWSWHDPKVRQEFYTLMATAIPGTRVVLRKFAMEWRDAICELRCCRSKWHDDGTVVPDCPEPKKPRKSKVTTPVCPKPKVVEDKPNPSPNFVIFAKRHIVIG